MALIFLSRANTFFISSRRIWDLVVCKWRYCDNEHFVVQLRLSVFVTNRVTPWGLRWSPVFSAVGRACPRSSLGQTWWGPQTDWCKPGSHSQETLTSNTSAVHIAVARLRWILPHLGASYSYLRPSIDVDAAVRFSANGAADSVGHADCQSTLTLAVSKRH